MNIEPHLRRALAPVNPPRGFADRVMARVSEREHGSRHPGWSHPSVRGRRVSPAWLALAASLVIAATGGVGYLQHGRRLAGERARSQVIEALRVTRAVLQAVHRSVAAEPSKPVAQD